MSKDRGVAEVKVMQERAKKCQIEKLLSDEEYEKAREELAGTNRRTLAHAMEAARNAFMEKEFLGKIVKALILEAKKNFKPDFYHYYRTLCLLEDFAGKRSDKSKTMLFENSGLLEHCVSVITDKKVRDLYFSLKPRLGIPSSHPEEMLRLFSCLVLVYEGSKLDNMKQKLRDIKVVDACSPYLLKGENNVDHNVMIMAFFTTAYCADEKESKVFEGNPRVLEYLVNLITKAQSSREHSVRILGYSNQLVWGVDELLQGILGFSVNDTNKRLLDSYGMLGPLYQALRDNKIDEQKPALKILWNMSFNSEVEKKLTTDAKWVVEFDKLKNSEDKELSDSALGILWNVRDEKEFIAKTHGKSDLKQKLKGKKAGKTAGLKPGYIMISYQHSTQEIILKIRDQLRASGNDIWIDVEQMTGSLLQKMAEAIEGADIVLMCICQKYKDSPNCRAEAEYAFARGKSIVPLVMEQGYRADGWLGILMGTKLYYDFSGKYSFEKKFSELMKEIEGIKASANSLPPIKDNSKAEPKSNEPKKTSQQDPPPRSNNSSPQGQNSAKSKRDTLKKMSQNQVKDWVTSTGLQWEKYKFLNGNHMAFLHTALIESPAHYYSIIEGLTSGKLTVSQLDEMVKFREGMDKFS